MLFQLYILYTWRIDSREREIDKKQKGESNQEQVGEHDLGRVRAGCRDREIKTQGWVQTRHTTPTPETESTPIYSIR